MWTPSSTSVSMTVSALRRIKYLRDSLQAAPPPRMPNGEPSVTFWACSTWTPTHILSRPYTLPQRLTSVPHRENLPKQTPSLHSDVGRYYTVSWPGASGTGVPQPRPTYEGEVDIRLRFQYHFYPKHEPPSNHVKPILIQVLHHIAIIPAALSKPCTWGI